MNERSELIARGDRSLELFKGGTVLLIGLDDLSIKLLFDLVERMRRFDLAIEHRLKRRNRFRQRPRGILIMLLDGRKLLEFEEDRHGVGVAKVVLPSQRFVSVDEGRLGLIVLLEVIKLLLERLSLRNGGFKQRLELSSLGKRFLLLCLDPLFLDGDIVGRNVTIDAVVDGIVPSVLGVGENDDLVSN